MLNPAIVFSLTITTHTGEKLATQREAEQLPNTGTKISVGTAQYTVIRSEEVGEVKKRGTQLVQSAEVVVQGPPFSF